jgi:uncharacterized membrane protein
MRPLLRPFLALALVVLIMVGSVQPALAARTGGRMGGSTFHSRPVPSRSYSRPSAPSYGGGYSRGYYPGGGFGLPFFLPFFTFGGGVGSLFMILVFIAIANFLVNSFRRAGDEGGGLFSGSSSLSNPTVSIAKLQIGVLASARELQPELDQIAQRAETQSSTGLAKLLQETSLALLRHPEYWVYGHGEVFTTQLTEAEAKFNQLALTERSKFQIETLSNVKGDLQTKSQTAALETPSQNEYVLVTLLAAIQTQTLGPLTIRTEDQLRAALNQLGAAAGEQLLALEVLWTPQSAGDTLSTEELLTAYPTLVAI